jgi:antitoxin component HigA of HigAB toxin-antitoxin module
MFPKVHAQCDACRIESDPVATMLFMMEERDVRVTELVPVLGSESAVEDVIAGKTEIDRSAAESIGKLLRVSSTLLS